MKPDLQKYVARVSRVFGTFSPPLNLFFSFLRIFLHGSSSPVTVYPSYHSFVAALASFGLPFRVLFFCRSSTHTHSHTYTLPFCSLVFIHDPPLVLSLVSNTRYFSPRFPSAVRVLGIDTRDRSVKSSQREKINATDTRISRRSSTNTSVVLSS